jgi:hypothetical protein
LKLGIADSEVLRSEPQNSELVNRWSNTFELRVYVSRLWALWQQCATWVNIGVKLLERRIFTLDLLEWESISNHWHEHFCPSESFSLPCL